MADPQQICERAQREELAQVFRGLCEEKQKIGEDEQLSDS